MTFGNAIRLAKIRSSADFKNYHVIKLKCGAYDLINENTYSEEKHGRSYFKTDLQRH